MSAWICAVLPSLGGLVVMFVLVYQFGPAIFVVPLLNRGRYAEALDRMRWLRWTVGAALVEGAVLFHADRLAEAERVLRASMARGRGGQATLVYILMAQGRYDDAWRNAREATEGRDEFGLVRSMAELFAGRASDPTLARLDRLWRARYGEDFVAVAIEPGAVAELHAMRAWALTVLSRPAEVPEAVRLAKDALPSASPGNAGQVWWVLAHAARAGSDPEAERAALESATKADPGGVFGRLARAALAKGLPAS